MKVYYAKMFSSDIMTGRQCLQLISSNVSKRNVRILIKYNAYRTSFTSAVKPSAGYHQPIHCVTRHSKCVCVGGGANVMDG